MSSMPPAFDGVSRGPCGEEPRDRVAPALEVAARARDPVVLRRRHVVAVGREEELLPEPEVRRHRVGRQRRERVAVLRDRKLPSLRLLHLEARRRPRCSAPARRPRPCDQTTPSGRCPGSGRMTVASVRCVASTTSRSSLSVSATKAYLPSSEKASDRGPETTSPKAPAVARTESSLACTERRASCVSASPGRGRTARGRPCRRRRASGCGVSVPSITCATHSSGAPGRGDDVVDARGLARGARSGRDWGPSSGTVHVVVRARGDVESALTPGPSRCVARSVVPSAAHASDQGLRGVVTVDVTVSEAASTSAIASSWEHAT